MPRIRLLRAVLVALALVVAVPAAGAAGAAGAIAAIDVTGNRRISADTVRRQLGLRPGDPADPARIDAALKALFATGQFADVRIDRRGDRLAVQVEEHPLVRRVSFEGLSALDEKAVKAAARIEPGSPWSRAAAEAAKERVRERYLAAGHDDVVVDARTSTRTDGPVDVALSVREGKATKVARVAFEGNLAFDAAALQDVITTRPAGLMDFLVPVPKHDELRLDVDREQLLRHYRSKGYADVTVAPAVSVRDPSTGDWRVTFRIDAGRVYRLGEVRIGVGATGLGEAALRRSLALEPGSVWDTTAIEAAIDRATLALIQSGQPDVSLDMVPHRDPARGIIAIEIVARVAARPRISRIEVVGNVRTRDHVIRRELSFVEGDAFHPLLAARAKRRLKALGIFKSIDVTAARSRDREGLAVTVAVVEQDTIELGWGIGYSSSEGVIGDVSLTERNLLGNGQYLKVLLAGSENRREAQLSFTEPYFLGQRLAAGFDLFYRNADQTLASSYKSTRLGGDVRVGFEVAENMRATLNYTLTRNTISHVGAAASTAVKQAVPGYPGTTSASYVSSSVGYSLAYDTRDSAASPARGVYISAGQDIAGVGGDVRYLKSAAEARGYLPVGERAVLATRAAGGTISSGWGGSEVRLLDMFYKGGETIRGFATGGIGPRDVLSANSDALGGTSYIATTAELRFGLPFTPSDFGLKAAVFADAGSLWGTSQSVKSVPGVVGTTAALRASVGVGLIWDSPVGALRVDYAVPLLKQPFDKTQAWRFGVMPF